MLDIFQILMEIQIKTVYILLGSFYEFFHFTTLSAIPNTNNLMIIILNLHTWQIKIVGQMMFKIITYFMS